MSLAAAPTAPQEVVPEPAPLLGSTHHVQFYDNYRYPADVIAAYLEEGLRRGGAAVFIGTADHIGPVQAVLTDHGVDVTSHVQGGRLVILDADVALASLHVDGALSAAAFEAVVGSRVRGLVERFGAVRACGEMVDVLCKRDRSASALELEGMWNALGHTVAFDLLCAYGLASFEDASTHGSFFHLCDQHMVVHLSGVDETSRAGRSPLIVELERRRIALRNEIERHAVVEAEQEQRLAAERFVANAARLSSSSLDYEETIERVAQLAIPAFADWCIVDLFTDDGEAFDRVGVGHHLPGGAEVSASLKRRYPLQASREEASRDVARCVRDAGDEALRALAPDDDHFPTIRAMGIRSFVVVPLLSRGRAIGWLTLAACEKNFGERDVWLAEQLALSSSAAIDNARLFAAEQRANERLRLLARAGDVLVQSLQLDETLRAVARLSVPAFADWCAIDLVEGSHIRRVATVHQDADMARASEEFARRHPPSVDDRAGIAAVVADARPRFIPRISPEAIRRAARDPDHLAFMEKAGVLSTIVLPLLVRDVCIGTISFSTAESGRIYDETDLHFAQELGRRADSAITNARLYHAAQEAAARAEEAARRAAEDRSRAEEANRIKDEFLATVSHELRTPLNAIAGWSTLLREKMNDPATVAKGLDVIRRNAQAQTKIVEDILDVSRIVTGKLKIDPRPVDMIAIIRDAMEVVRPSADARQVVLSLDTPSDAACLLVGDASRLQQVVWNLLSNGIKFTGAGGRVSVRVEQDGPSVSVTVSDTGRGIDPEFLPYVFERFRQADSSTTRKFGGLGLGLAIVRHIVELHGGRVSADSPGVGKGAVLQIVLPVRAVATPFPDEPPSQRGLDSLQLDRSTLEGARVLVVDDERDARELVEAVLADAGAVVRTASSAREALQALESFGPDVIVSDIGMPGQDGYAFIRQVRKRGSKAGAIPAVALTAYARSEDRIRALTCGYSTHVPKPVDPSELVAAVSSLCRVSRP